MKMYHCAGQPYPYIKSQSYCSAQLNNDMAKSTVPICISHSLSLLGGMQQIIALSKLQYIRQWHVIAACMLNRVGFEL
jgi:hypothetical protein